MRDIRFFGFDSGSEVTVGVSSGAISRGPLTVSAWQQPLADNGADIGDMTIDVFRAPDAAAPEIVWLEARVDSDPGLAVRANGDVGSATYAIYDQQFHELEFVWTLGDTATWDTPLRLPAFMMSKNYAHGPTISHAYDAPGDKTITCTVYRTDLSGDTQTSVIVARKTITLANGNAAPYGPVRAFEDVFPPAKRIYWNPDNDYSDIATETAAGARTGNDLAAATLWRAVEASNDAGGPYAILIKRGTSTVSPNDGLPFESPNHYVGTYGSGARPIVTADTIFAHNEATAAADMGGYFTIDGIDCRGNWDDINEAGTVTGGPFGLNSPMHMLIHDCICSAVNRNAVNINPTRGGAAGELSVSFINSEVRGYRNYGVFVAAAGSTENLLFGMRGSKIGRSPGAAFGGWGKNDTHNQHGPCRIEQSRYTCIQASEIVSEGDWGSVTQPALRLNTDPTLRPGAPGSLPAKTYVYGNLIEGGGGTVIAYTAAGSGPYPLPANGRIMHNIVLGSWTSRGGVLAQHGGTTIQENLVIYPDVPVWNKGQPTSLTENIRTGDAVGIGPGQVEPGLNDNNYTEPMRLIGNVFVDLKSTSESAEYGGITINTGFTGFIEDRDNYVHAPNRGTPQGGIGAMIKVGDFTPLIQNPRFDTLGNASPTGTRNHVTYTGFEAALGDLPMLKPTARTAPNGPLSRTDVFGTERPAQPTTGAIEPN